MDSLTHTVVGACLGEMIGGKKLGKRAMLHGVIANNLPDIDVIAQLWTAESKALLVHRGITHSILLCGILTFLLAWIFHRRNPKLAFSSWILMYGSGLFLHILLDACTSYGTGWFEPFNHARVSFNNLFILDPALMLPVLVSAIALLILKRDNVKRIKWARAGIILSGIYLCFTIMNKLRVNNVVEKNLRAQQIPSLDYMAAPTPLNNFLWYIISKSEKGFNIGYYSVFDKTSDITFEYFQKNDSLLQNSCEEEQLRDLKRFTKGYYCANIENDTIIFSDIRFGQIGGWYEPRAPFVFNFRLAQKCFNRSALQQGRFKSMGNEAMIQLFSRIRGIQKEKEKS